MWKLTTNLKVFKSKWKLSYHLLNVFCNKTPIFWDKSVFLSNDNQVEEGCRVKLYQ